jgi:hypothetical protein
VTSLITVAVILLAVFPLCLFTELVGQQARKAPVRPGYYLCLAGTWLGGVAVAYCGLLSPFLYFTSSRESSDWLLYSLVFLTGPLGGSVGPGLIYLYLRGRRTHDPDYGPLDPDVLKWGG